MRFPVAKGTFQASHVSFLEINPPLSSQTRKAAEDCDCVGERASDSENQTPPRAAVMAFLKRTKSQVDFRNSKEKNSYCIVIVGMGVTCAHEKWVTCAHGSLAPIGGGSLTPIGGTEDIHTFRVIRHGDMGFRGHGGHGDMGDMATWEKPGQACPMRKVRICHI